MLVWVKGVYRVSCDVGDCPALVETVADSATDAAATARSRGWASTAQPGCGGVTRRHYFPSHAALLEASMTLEPDVVVQAGATV